MTELRQQEINDRHFTADAMKEYSALHDEVSSLMALAAELVDDHAVKVAEESNPPTWERVGDMKHIRQLVKQIVAFLSEEGE